MTVNLRTLTRDTMTKEKSEVPMTGLLTTAATLTTLKKIAFTLFCCTVLMVFAAVAQPNNLGPPAGAIYDLNGQLVPGGGKNIYQRYTVQFTASVTSTAITFAFREDPGFISFANVSVVDLTAGTGNLLTNGDFSGGTIGSTTPTGWTYANNYGVTQGGGTLQSGCGVGPAPAYAYGVGNCWLDGAVQAYDAISQAIVTKVNDVYQISFWVADDSGFSGDGGCSVETPCKFSDISTNGDTTDRLGNGINVAAYAQSSLPPPDAQLTVTLLDSGTGTVTDNNEVPTINCSEASGTVTGTCSASYPFGTVVTLTATVGSGSNFAGWGGACAGSEGTTCTVTMNSAQNVTASFVVPGQTVTQTVTTGQQATFSYNGVYASGGNDYIAQLTSGSPVTASVTEISFGTQAACDAIIDTKFPGAHCFVTQNGGGVNADVPVGYELTCPGYPGTNGTCGSDTNPNFLATLGSDFHFQITENTGLGLVGTPPNKTLTYNGGNPLVGLVKYVGPDPLHPCTVNTPPVSASNQIGSFTLDDPGAKPVKGPSGGTGSCWLISYGMPGEAPTVTVAAPVNGGIYQLGQNDSTTKANYTCKTANNGNAATGPYLTGICSATDTPGGSVAGGAQFDTSTPGSHIFTATVLDSATNTASQTVSYTVQGAQVTLSPTSINFGNVYLFNVSVKAVTLKNTGNATLHINDVSLTFGQPDHSDFGFISLCPTSLLAGRSCTIFVGFFADEVGTQTATLVITDNAPGSPHQVSMTGTAIKRH
jgi:List-Bact-rpt repeat protein/HYDIN/CFA65/VesB family protein